MPNVQQERQKVADGCRILAGAGLAELFTGHVSSRITDDRILMPAHLHDDGRGMESITPAHVFEVDATGEARDEGAPEPPEEVVIHTQILAARSDVNSVAHAHPEYATGISASATELKPSTLDSMVFDGVVPVHDPGPRLLYTATDGDELAEVLGEKGAVLIRGHGVVTVGKTVGEATARMWLIERAARLQVIAEQAGGAKRFEAEVDPGFLRGSSEKPFDKVFQYLRNEYVDG